MIQQVIEERCNGCGWCELACPMDILRLKTITADGKRRKKAYITNRMDCLVCYNCEMFCPPRAIAITPEKPVPHPRPALSSG